MPFFVGIILYNVCDDIYNCLLICNCNFNDNSSFVAF